MSFTVKKLSGEPVLYACMPEDFDYTTEGQAIIDQILHELNTTDEPLFYIGDLTKADWSLEDIMAASAASARGPNAFLHHPKIRESFFLVQNKLWELVALGFEADVYGNLSIKVFRSLDEALDYVHSQ